MNFVLSKLNCLVNINGWKSYSLGIYGGLLLLLIILIKLDSFGFIETLQFCGLNFQLFYNFSTQFELYFMEVGNIFKMSKFAVDSLRKSDLIFEMLVRGSPEEMSVDDLRKKLRLLLAQNVEPNMELILLDDIPNQVTLCKRNSYVLKTDSENLGESTSKNEATRFRDRLLCFTNRLNILRELCFKNNMDEQIEILDKLLLENKNMLIDFNGKYQELVCRSPLINLEKNTSALSPAPMVNTQTENQDILTVPAENFDKSEKVTSVVNKFNFPFKVVENPSVLGTEQVVENPNLHYSGAEATVTSAFNSCYNRLAHPAEKLIAQIPRNVDGFDVDVILKFFRITLRILDAFPEMKSQVFPLIISYTQGPFQNCLLQYRNTGNFDIFHSMAIKTFIPERQLYVIIQNLVLRRQGDQERLPEFIRDVRESAAVLRVGMSEAELVSVILEGINSHVRSLATFCKRPTNFSELHELCIHIMNVAFVQGTPVPNSRHPVEARPANGNFPRFSGAKPVVCHYCKKEGHIKPHCQLLLRKQNYSKNVNSGP